MLPYVERAARLLGELAGGRQHDDARQAPVLLTGDAVRVLRQQPLHDGQHEGQRLALARPVARGQQRAVLRACQKESSRHGINTY